MTRPRAAAVSKTSRSGSSSGGGAGNFEADLRLSGLLRLGLRPQPRSGEKATVLFLE